VLLLNTRKEKKKKLAPEALSTVKFSYLLLCVEEKKKKGLSKLQLTPPNIIVFS